MSSRLSTRRPQARHVSEDDPAPRRGKIALPAVDRRPSFIFLAVWAAVARWRASSTILLTLLIAPPRGIASLTRLACQTTNASAVSAKVNPACYRDIINSPGKPGRERPVSGAISEGPKSGSQAPGTPAPLLSPLTSDSPGYRHDLKAVARIIQGDGVIVSPRRRARFSAPRTGSRGQACLVS